MNSLRELESRANHYISALQQSAREVDAATREIHSQQQQREKLSTQLSRLNGREGMESQGKQLQSQIQRCDNQIRKAQQRQSTARSSFSSAASHVSGVASEAERGASQTAAGAQHYSTGQHAGGRFNASSLQAIATRARNLAERCRRALAEAQSRVNSAQSSGRGVSSSGGGSWFSSRAASIVGNALVRTVSTVARMGLRVGGFAGRIALRGLGLVARIGGMIGGGLHRSFPNRKARWSVSYPSNLVSPAASSSSKTKGTSKKSVFGNIASIIQPNRKNKLEHDHSHGSLEWGHAQIEPYKEFSLGDKVFLGQRVQVSRSGERVHVENRVVDRSGPRRPKTRILDSIEASTSPKRSLSNRIKDAIEEASTSPKRSLTSRIKDAIDASVTSTNFSTPSRAGTSASGGVDRKSTLERMLRSIPLPSEDEQRRYAASWGIGRPTVDPDEFAHNMAQQAKYSYSRYPDPKYANPHNSVIYDTDRYYRH